MRPSYYQNIAIYANQAGVQWLPQGVPHIGYAGYGMGYGFYHIPIQSQNPHPQTPPNVPLTVTSSVSTEDIPSGAGAHPMVTSMQITMLDLVSTQYILNSFFLLGWS